jgi:predicted membrane-bound spermidine synthase
MADQAGRIAAPTQPGIPRRGRSFLLTVFVVSGFAGLIYESVWSHYLQLFLGHAAYAQTLVLAIFMGGMALGSALVARWSSRLRQLLLAYVLVEALIGAFGLVFHRVFIAASDYSLDTLVPALSSAWEAQAYKWVLGALLILPQSILLGATFPLISGGIIRRWPERPGATLAMLYFTNSLGAAVGVLVSGFVLIRLVGLPGTVMTAGLLNVVLALLVWLAVREHPEPLADASAPTLQLGSMLRQWFTVAAFLTGAASLMYEMAWIRMLSLVLGSSTHSFELMLSAFIFGLALGGLWIRRRVDTWSNPYLALGLAMLATGGCALLTLPIYNSTFNMMGWTMRAVSHTAGGYALFNLSSQTLAAAIMLPATFFAGMTLPLLTHALLRTTSEAAIGVIYGANTVGAILGVLLAIHVLMPMVGVKGIILAGAFIHMGLGVSGLWQAGETLRHISLATATAAGVALAACALLVNLDARKLTAGVYRHGQVEQAPDARVRYLRDGKTATISLVDQSGAVTIATNGKPDAAIMMAPGGPLATDEITMVLAGVLPLSMHAHPARVANIGVGSGLTSDALLDSPRVHQLDSIEIEPLMVEAARLGFYPRNRRLFDDPRSRIHIEDAKTYFSLQHERYDVIVAEPSNPWVSGVASLFSQEFYRRINRYLKPDGLFVQWLQIYETDMTVVASVLAALSANFSDYAVYNVDFSNLVIVATPNGSLPESTSIPFTEPNLRAELEHIGIQSVADIESRLVGRKGSVDSLMASYRVPANSDYFPYVDLNAPRLRFMQSDAVEFPSSLLLPLPLVAMLNARPAAPRQQDSPHIRPSDEYAARALAINGALSSGSLQGLDAAAASAVFAVRMPAATCAIPGADDIWRTGVRIIADATASHLDTRDLEHVWASIEASACAQRASAESRSWLSLLRAVAMRDATAMRVAGESLIQTPAMLHGPEDLAYGVAAAALGALASGRESEAATLLDGYSANSLAPKAYQLPMRWLRACASSRSCFEP